MAFLEYQTVRSRTRALLAESGTALTAAAIADEIGTSTNQAARALRELERRGQVVREARRGRQDARGGRCPDEWRAAR
jgi:predicted ArsR family transcriptional regulator